MPLGVTGKINTMDVSALLPGDLAFTRSGAHVLVYFGDGKWIQADPGPAAWFFCTGGTTETNGSAPRCRSTAGRFFIFMRTATARWPGFATGNSPRHL
ncbi:MAG: hypothetical protein U1G05_11240 [Kiritimatiellia bacterium]